MSEKNQQSGWGKRWVDAVEQLSTVWTKQMPRGKDYAAKGHVNKLDVRSGKITARVQGSRSKPYITTLELQPHKEEAWTRLTEALVEQAGWVAQLLNGTMPEDIETHFENENLALFPTRNSELIAVCNCPEKARPCKHIAAVHYAFAEALEGDPFLLFKLRGLDRQELIEGIRRAWFPDATSDQESSKISGRQNDEPIMPLSADRFNRSSDEIPEITIHLRPQKDQQELLSQLGVPQSWSLPIPPSEILNSVVEQASKLAWDFAYHHGDADLIETEEFSEDVDIEDEDKIDNPLFRALSATVPEAPVTTENLPTNLPDAAVLQGAVGVDLDATEKNQSRNVGKKRAERSEAQSAQPVMLRRRSGKKKSTTPVEGVVTRKAAKKSTEDAASKEAVETGVATRKKSAAKRRRVVVAPPPDAAETPAQQREKNTDEDTVVEAVGSPVVRRRTRRKVVGAAPTRKQPVALDTAARAAWEEGDAQKTWDNALEAWRIEPSDTRYQLLAASADRMNGIVEHFKELAEETEDNARRGGRRVSTAQLLVLLSAGRYDTATEFIMAMDDGAWIGEDPPGAVYLSFLLMALGADLSVPDESNLGELWGELFARGEESFPTSDDPPAPVGAWLDFALQDAPFDLSQEEQYLQVAKNLGIGVIETAREQPLQLRPSQISTLAVAVAEALQLLASEDECDSYTAVASARAAADPMLGRSVREAIAESTLLGFGGA